MKWSYFLRGVEWPATPAQVYLSIGSGIIAIGTVFAQLVKCLWFKAGWLSGAGAGDSIHRLHGKFFKYLTREKFDEIHYSRLRSYKMATIFRNVVPLVALSLT
ncbi:MAG: DUF6868 family protein [Planctomycetales bacterium]|jgi:hypothetical protein